MAYAFVGASEQYLTCAAPATGNPVSISAWFRPANVTGIKTIFTLGTGDNAQRYWCYLSGGGVFYEARDAAGFSQINLVSVPASAGVWYHVLVVELSGGGRRIYGNGTLGSTSAAARNPASVDELYIGIDRASNTFSNPMTGDIAEVAVWNAALTADDATALSKAASPRLVRPQSLVFYSPLIRDLQDLARGATITNGNTATVAVHPRIYA